MNKQYICPHCSGHLKIGDNIILIGQNKANQKGIILLHPEIGNYSSLKHPMFKVQIKEAIKLYCPMCQESLTSDFDENLSHLLLIEKENTFDIYFSRIHGEQSTYMVDGDTVTATGEHSDRYTCFKMDDKFKKFLQM